MAERILSDQLFGSLPSKLPSAEAAGEGLRISDACGESLSLPDLGVVAFMAVEAIAPSAERSARSNAVSS